MLKGVAASPGVAIGKAFLFYHEDVDLPHYTIDESKIDAEIARFQDAMKQTRRELLDIQKKSEEEMTEVHARIFQAHILLLEDPMFVDEIPIEIEKSRKNAEYIVKKVTDDLVDQLSKLQDEYLSGRTIDIHDVARRIIHNLLEKERLDLSTLSEEVIIIAQDLSPADTALMKKEYVLGFATNFGSRTSHTAIMARALEIPAVVGLGTITSEVKNGDLVIIDGSSGEVLVNPEESIIQSYISKQERFLEFERSLDVLRDLPAVTIDNHSIDLAGNIEIPEEIDSVLHHGANGIGLYRTEFIYIRQKEGIPSEEEQYQLYKDSAEKMAPNPVIIRTLDLGGDKFASQLQLSDDVDSMLGLRGIRLCLQRPDIFLPQLRAILRASAHGNIKIMFPMVSGIEEFRQAKALLDQAKKDLDQKEIPYKQDIEIGLMIEVPAAAMTSDILAREADFFSIGTNDLIQYSLAIHRGNQGITHLYEPLHPAVLRLIRYTIDAAHNAGIWIGMCGEMAGDPVMVPILLGMGLDELSMSPTAVPEVKKLIRSLTLKEAQEMTQKAFSLSTPWEIESYVYGETMKKFPELLTWISLRA
ncbi:phosphoenolpyruvate--protein phosphotransferase [Candidatus Poribacteria bacterium]|nr:phosphoenolpyruvate--protein phosphotransferase [Candidatus Poribacteria bacterium]